MAQHGGGGALPSLRVQAPQPFMRVPRLYPDDDTASSSPSPVPSSPEKQQPERAALLPVSHAHADRWLRHLEQQQRGRHPRRGSASGSTSTSTSIGASESGAHEWLVLGRVRLHRAVEVVHLKHAHFGLRWQPSRSERRRRRRARKKKQQQELDPAMALEAGGGGDDDEEEEEDLEDHDAPSCMMGPHWWLMALTFSVFALAATTVTVLTLRQADSGETLMGVLLSVACLSMYALVGCTDPGIVRPMLTPRDDSYTFCDECDSFRPPGALHCMDCRVCIEEYDHHCPWTGKCIGRRNVKFFYAWLFFLVLAFVYEMIEFTTYMLPPPPHERALDDDDDSFARVLQPRL